MNTLGAGQNWLGRGLIIGVVLILAYSWYLQQQAKVLPQSKPLLLPKVAEHQVNMSQVSLPPPPPLPEVKSKPAPKPASKAVVKKPIVSKPKPKVAAQSEIKPQPQLQQQKVVDVSADSHSQLDAEPLLQQVESGRGPGIEIAWPNGANKRRQLFARLVDCLGVGLGALVGSQVKQIYGQPGEYSRLVRMVSGQMVAREQDLHRQSDINGVPVRLFPRDLDARLLAGLAHLAQGPIANFRSIQGLYELRGRQLYVTRLNFDGRTKPGEILLSKGFCRK